MDVRERAGAVDQDAGRVRRVDTANAMALPVEDDVVASDLDADGSLHIENILGQFVAPGLVDHHGACHGYRRTDPDCAPDEEQSEDQPACETHPFIIGVEHRPPRALVEAVRGGVGRRMDRRYD